MVKWVPLALASALLVGAMPIVAAQPLELVPQPDSVRVMREKPGLKLGRTLAATVPADRPLWREHVRVLGGALRLLHACDVELASRAKGEGPRLTLEADASCAAEAYRLDVADNEVRVRASTIRGVAHATSTLLQLLGTARGGCLPRIAIHDAPSCPYRSFMVDVGRNPHSLTCLKETIDLLWFYKVDSLHLHLTDDQRFAFPSRAFPRLVTRRGKISWEEFRGLERYAETRGVSIIPELEVPGHSTLLRRAYPEVFGKQPTDVARLKSSRDAIKVLLDEMIEVFPSSPYVHIGGDEAYGVPAELQRDLINDLDAHLKKKGKRTVVWEGPGLGTGDNKVHEDVIHVNWRTVNFPANRMLAAGYSVVNAAWDPLYIVDHYPRNNFTMASPQYIYTQLDLYRFKHYNPGMPTFSRPVRVEPDKRVLGFCMPWWEGREVNYFPLIVPRLIPMAAVAWNRHAERDYSGFARRAETCENTRARCFYPAAISAAPLALEREGVFHHRTTVKLSASVAGTIRYTLDGTEPAPDSTAYREPIALSRTTTVRAAVFAGGVQVGHGQRRTFVHVEPVDNLALGKPVSASVSSGPLFSLARLTDGGTGNLDYFLGYPAMPDPISITVDLGERLAFDQIVVHTYFNGRSYESYVVQVSEDGKTFRSVADRRRKPEKAAPRVVHDIPATTARYVRIVTYGHKGQVFDSFSRITEIQVFSTCG